MRMSVADVLEYLAADMSIEEVLADFPYLEREDILACLAYAAERERERGSELPSLREARSSTKNLEPVARCTDWPNLVHAGTCAAHYPGSTPRRTYRHIDLE